MLNRRYEPIEYDEFHFHFGGTETNCFINADGLLFYHGPPQRLKGKLEAEDVKLFFTYHLRGYILCDAVTKCFIRVATSLSHI